MFSKLSSEFTTLDFMATEISSKFVAGFRFYGEN